MSRVIRKNDPNNNCGIMITYEFFGHNLIQVYPQKDNHRPLFTLNVSKYIGILHVEDLFNLIDKSIWFALDLDVFVVLCFMIHDPDLGVSLYFIFIKILARAKEVPNHNYGRLKYLFGLGIPMVVYRSSNLNLVLAVIRSVLASDQELFTSLWLAKTHYNRLMNFIRTF
ncbi:hypothetical protein ACJX0J_026761 [Zea mays]